MSIQWTLIAGFMYIEVALTILLLIPLISPGRWHMIFNSRFLRSIINMSHVYLKVILGSLSLFILDAIREMIKYTTELEEQRKGFDVHVDAENLARMKLFRAQRNFYIVGFSILFWFILQRLMSLISRLATAQAANDSLISQLATSQAANKASLDQDIKAKAFSNDEAQQKMTNVANEIKELKEEKRRLEAERNAALKQAEGVKHEYDRMLEEHAKLQVKTEAGGAESKKDN